MSLISRARAGDKQAIETMFRQFIPPDEQIDGVAFLGLRGLFGIGVHSFGAVTSRRVAGMDVSVLGGVVYRDGYYEHINSSAVFHPSRLQQYLVTGSIGAFWLFPLAMILSSALPALAKAFGLVAVLGMFVISMPLTAKLFYRFVKSGLVIVVREGVSVDLFADRSRLPVANQLSQRASQLREVRLRTMRSGPTVVSAPTAPVADAGAERDLSLTG
jgi:hypothetical protein